MEIKKIDLDRAEALVESSPKMNASSVSSKKVTMPSAENSSKLVPAIIILVIAVLGVVSGSFLKMSTANKQGQKTSEATAGIKAAIPQSGVKVGDIYGSADETAFKDHSTGVIDKGGFNGEGTHKLVRPGGASQTVYLTSSVIDLDQLVGHQVTVWGETFKGQKVGWLMDVGRAKVENLNMPLPK